jgi:hypothetical protein
VRRASHRSCTNSHIVWISWAAVQCRPMRCIWRSTSHAPGCRRHVICHGMRRRRHICPLPVTSHASMRHTLLGCALVASPLWRAAIPRISQPRPKEVRSAPLVPCCAAPMWQAISSKQRSVSAAKARTAPGRTMKDRCLHPCRARMGRRLANSAIFCALHRELASPARCGGRQWACACPSFQDQVGGAVRTVPQRRLQAACIREGIGTPGTVNEADGASGERNGGRTQRATSLKISNATPGSRVARRRVTVCRQAGQSAHCRQTSPDPWRYTTLEAPCGEG